MWKGVVASSLGKGQSAAKDALLSKIEAYTEESTEKMFRCWVKRVNTMGTGRFMSLSLQRRQLSVVHVGFTDVKGLALVVRVGVQLKQLDVAAWMHVRSITIEPVPGKGKVSSLRFPEIPGVSFKLKPGTLTYIKTRG